MSATMTLPRLGETMETGRVVAWLKQPGEAFRRGEVVVEIETDKTVVELPAIADGVMGEILVPDGAEASVGDALCRYEGEDAAIVPDPVVAPGLPPEAPVPNTADRVAAGARSRATPLARRIARMRGIDLATVVGTGRRGRIEARDVEGPKDRPADAGLADGPRLRWIEMQEGRLAYRVWQPAGEPTGTIVLLHGFAGDAQTWASVAAILARNGLTVVAPDLPAHGETTIEAASLDGIVGPVLALLRTLGGPVHLAGHSLGGAAALAVARAMPSGIDRLTLMAPAGLGGEIDGDFIAGMASASTGGALGHLTRRLALRPPALSSEQLDRMAAGLGGRGRLGNLAHALVANGRQQIDSLRDLEAVEVPATVLWGLDDAIIPWTQVTRVPSRVAIHLIRNAGHMAHWDRLQDVASLLA